MNDFDIIKTVDEDGTERVKVVHKEDKPAKRPARNS